MIKFIPRDLAQFKRSGDKEQLDGQYAIPHPWIQHYHILVMVSTKQNWEHAAVTLLTWKKADKKLKAPATVDRCPTWEEMSFVKSTFWEEEEAVMMLHYPQSDFIELNPNCLHLWRSLDQPFTLPDRFELDYKDQPKMLEALLGKLTLEIEEVAKRLPHCKPGPEKELMEAAKEAFEKQIAHVKTRLKDVTTKMAEESDTEKGV